jgi:hypothetical protein
MSKYVKLPKNQKRIRKNGGANKQTWTRGIIHKHKSFKGIPIMLLALKISEMLTKRKRRGTKRKATKCLQKGKKGISRTMNPAKINTKEDRSTLADLAEDQNYSP